MNVLERQRQRELFGIVAPGRCGGTFPTPMRETSGPPSNASITEAASNPRRRATATELATPSAVKASMTLFTSFIREP